MPRLRLLSLLLGVLALPAWAQDAPKPPDAILLFGQEGPGLSDEALRAAAAIVMHEWIRRWAV